MKNHLQNMLGFLRDATARQPKPIQPNAELPDILPTADQLAAIQTANTTSESPLITLWPDNEPRPPDSDREAPYVTRGRYAEINRLSRLLDNPPRAVHLITGPPGSGKSTLLNTMVEYASRHGFLPVQLTPTMLLDPATVIEEIRQQGLGAALAGSRLDIAMEQTVADETTGGADGGILRGEHKRGTTDKQTQHRQQTGNPQLLRHLREVVAILRNEHPHIRGIIIYCDEFQKLHKHSEKSADAYITLSDQMYTLNELLRKQRPQLPVITLLAGIPPAHQTLQNLLSRKSQATTYELLPIDGYPVPDPRAPHCTFILHDYLQASRRALGHRFHIPLALLHIWGINCRGHVLHATHAGGAIQSKLEEIHDAGKQQLTAEDFAAIDKAIRKERNEYYRGRIMDTYKNKPVRTSEPEIKLVTQHVVLAIHQQRPPTHSVHPLSFLTWDTIWEIATQALPDKDGTKASEILEHLQHKGIITHMQNDGRFPHYDEPEPSHIQPVAYADCLIPTLSEHICQTIDPEDTAKIQCTIDGVVQKKAHLAYTQWCWSQAIHMKKIARIPDLDYTPPIFPRVFTPIEARDETNQLLDEMAQSPDARDPFIQQTISEMRRATDPVRDNQIADRPHRLDSFGPDEVESDNE